MMRRIDLYILMTGFFLCSFTSGTLQEETVVLNERNSRSAETVENTADTQGNAAAVLDISNYKSYIDIFNMQDDEYHRTGCISNDQAWDFLSRNIPFFDCPDKQLEKTYYFRWWTYRKHIKQTPDGYIITEFLPDVPWAGRFNAIACPAAQHFMEGRWLKDPIYMEEYARFWMNGKAAPRAYSFWITDAVTNFTYVHPDDKLLQDLFPAFEKNFNGWIQSKQDSTGLFWQKDDRDGMECSISGGYNHCGGRGYRATINSYMYAEAKALAGIAQKTEEAQKYDYYTRFAENLKEQMNKKLWDKNADFYKVIPRGSKELSDARELHGYTPWYFNIPPEKYSSAWKFIMDSRHFYAPYGLTTAEQCHPLFKISYEGHACKWNGPIWPFSTSITLTAMANLLNNYEQDFVTVKDYYILLTQYSRMHSIDLYNNGHEQPWIDENMNPYTGDWIARTCLKNEKNGIWNKKKEGTERGRDYNHSSFNDLIITGLIGIRPEEGKSLTIHPLVPENQWDYFCLDCVNYKGNVITVMYDKYGTRYKKGTGYHIYINGKEAAQDSKVCKKTVILP